MILAYLSTCLSLVSLLVSLVVFNLHWMLRGVQLQLHGLALSQASRRGRSLPAPEAWRTSQPATVTARWLRSVSRPVPVVSELGLGDRQACLGLLLPSVPKLLSFGTVKGPSWKLWAVDRQGATRRCLSTHSVRFRRRPTHTRAGQRENIPFLRTIPLLLYILAGGAVIVIGGVAYSCVEEVPISGRRRFNMLSADFDAFLGKLVEKAAIRQFGGKTRSENDATLKALQRLVERLVAAAPEGTMPPHVKWKVVVIESPTVNAFALPNGTVGVCAGMIKLLKTMDEASIVVGHELAHVLARHSAERVSKSVWLLAFSLVAPLLIGGDHSLYEGLCEFLIQLPNSRLHETEADHIGLLLAAGAGHDFKVAPGFWKMMNELPRKDDTPSFLRTHPAPEKRAENLLSWQEEAAEWQEKYCKDKERLAHLREKWKRQM